MAAEVLYPSIRPEPSSIELSGLPVKNLHGCCALRYSVVHKHLVEAYTSECHSGGLPPHIFIRKTMDQVIDDRARCKFWLQAYCPSTSRRAVIRADLLADIASEYPALTPVGLLIAILSCFNGDIRKAFPCIDPVGLKGSRRTCLYTEITAATEIG
jgi:hypothetical protein